jgi:hypothetical protein
MAKGSHRSATNKTVATYRAGTRKELNDILNNTQKNFNFARFGIRIPTKKP